MNYTQVDKIKFPYPDVSDFAQELDELKNAVAWYFECIEVEKYRTLKCINFKSRHLDMYLGKIPMDDFTKQVRRVCKDSILELRESLKYAEKQLRKLIGINNVE